MHEREAWYLKVKRNSDHAGQLKISLCKTHLVRFLQVIFIPQYLNITSALAITGRVVAITGNNPASAQRCKFTACVMDINTPALATPLIPPKITKTAASKA